MSTAELEKRHGVELLIPDEIDSVLLLSWCIPDATGRMLEELDIRNPKLLIVISSNGQEMDRHVVPLFDLAYHVTFRRPGINTIHATIVWETWGKNPAKVLAARYDNGSFRTDVVVNIQPRADELSIQREELFEKLYALNPEDDGDQIAELQAQINRLYAERQEAWENDPHVTVINPHFDSFGFMRGEARRDVDIPSGMFADKPSRLMRWLGNIYSWESTPRDQCHLRRRVGFTLLTLPISLVFALAAIAIAGIVHLLTVGILLLLGMRGINYEQLGHPLEHKPKHAWRDTRSSVWLTRKIVVTEHDETKVYYENRVSLSSALYPLAVVVLAAIIVVSWLFLDVKMWQFLAAGTVAVLVLIAIIAISEVARDYDSGTAKLERERREQLELELQRERERERERFLEELRLLACRSRNPEASLSALPPQKRTLRLRYKDAKAKAQVCKPFARK